MKDITFKNYLRTKKETQKMTIFFKAKKPCKEEVEWYDLLQKCEKFRISNVFVFLKPEKLKIILLATESKEDKSV